jgi:phenylpyruvate tautomerase
MPFLKIVTNVPESKIPPNYPAYLTELIHSVLQKPKEYIFVHIIPDQIINFGGSHGPSALIEFMTIGRLDGNDNEKYSRLLMSELEKSLNILPHQTYIHFVDPKLSDINSPETDTEFHI